MSLPPAQDVTNWFWMGLAGLATLQAILLRLGVFDSPTPLGALIYGAAIVASAFLLSWAAEPPRLTFRKAYLCPARAHRDPARVRRGRGAWPGSQRRTPSMPVTRSQYDRGEPAADRARLALVVGIAFFRYGKREVHLDEGTRLEVVVSWARPSTLFLLPLKGTISLGRPRRCSLRRSQHTWSGLPGFRREAAPRGAGPARRPASPGATTTDDGLPGLIAAAVTSSWPNRSPRRSWPPGSALASTSSDSSSWLAPLASEAPEFLVVALFAWRGSPPRPSRHWSHPR